MFFTSASCLVLVSGSGSACVCYWTLVYALQPAGIPIESWAGMYVLTVPISCTLITRQAWVNKPRAWLALAAYSMLGALFFYGVNGGLDALHGADRQKANVAASLGGIQFWFVLVPGLFSIAIGGWIAAIVRLTASRRRDLV